MKKLKNGNETTPALIALRRAAKEALKLARQTGTPCHVEIDGMIVDIAKTKPQGAKRSCASGRQK
jgi:hypothetical protein